MFLVLCLFADDQPAGERGTRQKSKNSTGRSFAILVGINKYYDLKPLNYCENDINALCEQFTKIGFAKQDVFKLTPSMDVNDHPTKDHIEATIDHVLDLTEPEDTVIIAFAGHGAEIAGKPLFCPMDTKQDDLEGTTIAIGGLFSKLNKNKAKFKLLIVDACREQLSNTRSIGNTARSLSSADFNPPEGIALLQSCKKGEFSYEIDELKHGVFTHFMIEGLKGSADSDKDGVVTFLELQQYVAAKTKDRVFRDTKKSQNPSATMKDVSDFPIAKGLQNFDESQNQDTDTIGKLPTYEDVIEKGKGSEIHTKLARWIKEHETDPAGYFHRGIVYYFQNLYDESLNDIDKAIKLGGNDPEIQQYRKYVIDAREAAIPPKKNDNLSIPSKPAIPPPDELIAMIPNYEQQLRDNVKNKQEQKNKEIFFLLGAAYYHKSEGLSDKKLKENALKQAKAKLNLATSHALLAQYKQDVEAALQKLPSPISPASRPIVPQPTTAEQYYFAGVDKMNKGNNSEAFREFNAALRLEPNYPEALAIRSMIYAQSNQLSLAIDDIDKAIRLDPKNQQYQEVKNTILKKKTSRR
ncbi:hypothetical protein FACS189427_05000 [Planctomycetales bacterium]|nr:hypothetical protein FACS189427_05000 [Planctomycetales bacterium]